MEGRLESVRHNTHVHVVWCWLAGWQLHTQALPTGEELICSLATHTQGFFQRGARRNVVVALLDSLGLVAEGDGGVLIFVCYQCPVRSVRAGWPHSFYLILSRGVGDTRGHPCPPAQLLCFVSRVF